MRFCFAVLSLVFTVDQAAAALFEIDLSSAGDGLVTLDDTSGLLWLDGGLTDGLSYNDVVSGTGNQWYAQGWRHATTPEMCGLFRRYVVAIDPCPDPLVTALPSGAADYLLGFMEPNSDPGDPLALNGAFDDGPESIHVGQGAIWLGVPEHIVVQAPNGVSADVHQPSIGNWLVRPIPEPSTVVLVAAGLVGLVLRAPTYHSPRTPSSPRSG